MSGWMMFLLGLFVGAGLGIFIASLLAAGGRSDEE